DDAIQAFVILKQEFPTAKFWVIGKKDERYIQQQLDPLVPEEIRGDITYFGFVSAEEKLERMSRATALLFPSKREGWGLTVSEAAAVGTPTIVYDAPGLRDAVQYGMAGYMTVAQSPGALASEMRSCIQDTEQYDTIRYAAYRFAQTLHWDNTGQHFRNWLQNELPLPDVKEEYV
ncbi:MAG: glycosyltransferase, partial [Exiguobacterium undae]